MSIMIQIGNNPAVSESAKGLVYIYDGTIITNKTNKTMGIVYCQKCKVVYNPNGWNNNIVSHEFNPKYDKILKSLNSVFKDSLIKY